MTAWAFIERTAQSVVLRPFQESYTAANPR